MIILDELKPILESLLEGREDAADIIEQVSVLDKPAEVDRSEIDALNASWNDRFMKAFFGEKADDMSAEIPSVPDETDDVVDETDVEETLTYDNLFEEVKDEEKEED